MPKFLAPARPLPHVVARPPTRKLRADLLEIADELRAGIVTDVLAVSHTELGHDALRVGLPINNTPSPFHVREGPPESVAFTAHFGPKVSKNHFGRLVPREHVPTASSYIGRADPHVSQHASKDGRGLLVGRRLRRRRLAGEHEKVRSLGTIHAQRSRNGVERLRRDVNVTSLLQPRVPSQAHRGELGYLFAPQPRRPSRCAFR